MLKYLKYFIPGLTGIITIITFFMGEYYPTYFLIGFWFKKPSANAAAIKAFLVNRVGDFGFALGIFLIFYIFGTVNYDEVFQRIPEILDKKLFFLGININAVDLICVCL